MKYEKNLAKNGQQAVYKYVRCKMLSKVSVPLVRDCNNELATNEFESTNLLATFFNNPFVDEPIDNLPHYTVVIKFKSNFCAEN